MGRTVPSWAIASAGLTPILLTGGWLVAGALQPASYNPIRETVSVMAGHAGTDRWVMTGALLLVGGCHLVTAAGLGCHPGLGPCAADPSPGCRRIGIATSPEPVLAPPPAPRLDLVRRGHYHGIAGFHGPPGSPQPLILSRRGSAVVTAVFLALLCWLVIETQGGSELGMAERLTSSVQTSWPFVVAVVLWRHAAGSRRPGEPPDAPRAQATTAEAMTAEALTTEAH